MQPSATPSDRQPFDVLLALVSHWKLLVFCPLVAAVLSGAVATFVLQKTYEAKSVAVITGVKVQKGLEPKLSLTEPALNPSNRGKALVAMAKMMVVAVPVLEQLKDRLPEKERSAEALLEMVEVRLEGDMILIIARHHLPELATAISNTWVKVFENKANMAFVTGVPGAKEFHVRQSTLATERHQKAEEALQQHIGASKLGVFKRELDDLTKIIDDQDARFNRIQQIIDDCRSIRAHLNGGSKSGLGGALGWASLKAQALTLASGNKLEVQVQVSPAAGSPVLDEGPTAKDLDKLIEQLTARAQEITRQKETGKQEKRMLELEEGIEQETNRRRQLSQERDLAWEAVTILSRKVLEDTIAAPEFVVFAIPAEAPREPSGPRKLLIVFFSVCAAGVVALGWSILVERLRLLPQPYVR